MIDQRLQDLLAAEASQSKPPSPRPATGESTSADPTEPPPASDTDATPAAVAQESPSSSRKALHALIDQAAQVNPDMAPIAEAAKGEVRMSADGQVIVSDALRAAMRALVPGRDKAPTDTAHRSIGGWLTADNSITTPVTGTSPYFTVSHWHWLAATGLVRPMPSELGPTFPHLLTSEAQIVHDLKAWSALDDTDRLTAEAATMFGAVTGHAALTVFGTVLLYAQRRSPASVPPLLKEFGLEAAVRDVPRVTFVVGLTDREVVTALVNNTSVVFTRRLRRSGIHADAASAVLDLLNPEGHWRAHPLPAPIVLPADVVDQLAQNPDASALIDTAADPDDDDATKAQDAALRDRSRKATRRVLSAAKTPAGSSAIIAEMAACTTHALAQITVATNQVDVARGEPGALALVFLREAGMVASYPSGAGKFRRITYRSGTASGIEAGIKALSSAYNGG